METKTETVNPSEDESRILTDDEKAELRREKTRRELSKVDVSDVGNLLEEQSNLQRTRKMSPEAEARSEARRLADYGVKCEVEVVDGGDEDGDPNPYQAEIHALAQRTPEVRFTKAAMLRKFSDEELKIIAAALRTSVPLYRVADSLHCSVRKLEGAIKNIPILTELAQEKIMRRKEQAQEAVDDCIKARVPAVVMWNAEKLLPEIYGNEKNMDNEDDTKLVIGALSAEDLAAADAAVAAASSSVPQVEVGAVMEVMTDERGAEMVNAGGGVPVTPLKDVPPAPALQPPPQDNRFMGYVPMSETSMKPIVPPPTVSDEGPDNYGVVGGGFDDDPGDGWI